MEKKRIKRALISVYHKEKLDLIVQKLNEQGVTFISTGGTKSFIESLSIPCDAVEDLTGYPSILGGRVKTLHPKVFGGILSRRDFESDTRQLNEYEIPEIDLVIVDLYPFEATVAAGADERHHHIGCVGSARACCVLDGVGRVAGGDQHRGGDGRHG